MKSKQNILFALILNTAFSIFELVGGILTGSVAIASDAVHDMGDAISIGISYWLEKKSQKDPDEQYTYGYGRYSVMGGLITTFILLMGSAAVLYNAIHRFITPAQPNYNGMIVFAVIGVLVNGLAAYYTAKGESLNQKAVNLHMLEDVLGWVVVLIGAIIMKFTNIAILDPILSIAVSLYIVIHAIRNLKEILNIFLEKAPNAARVDVIREHIEEIDGVSNVHHIHLWSIDGTHNYATMHVVTNADAKEIKQHIRKELLEHNVHHVTIEIEASNEPCAHQQCHIAHATLSSHAHHHH